MPVVHVDLRRELVDQDRLAVSRAIHAGPVMAEDDVLRVLRPREEAGVRHDGPLTSVVDVGSEDRYAGGPTDERAQR